LWPEAELPHTTLLRRVFCPDLVKPELTAFAVGMVGIKDSETRLSGEGLQLWRRKVVHIAQAVTTTAPVQKIIALLDILIAQIDGLPGQDARPETVAG